MSARVDMLAGMALQGLLAHPHQTAHPMLAVDVSVFAVRAVALARAVDAELGPEPVEAVDVEEAAPPVEPKKKNR